MSQQQLVVAKFGGTSVATAAQLRKVQAIIEADPRRRVVVPSAPGKAFKDDTKITDLLYLCHNMVAQRQSIDAIWAQISNRFLSIVEELGLALDLRPVLDETRAVIQAGTTPDYVASRGEAIHGRVVAALLGARYIDAAEVVRFARSGGLDAATNRLISDACKGPGRVVIPGFYGADRQGHIKTFSRGGSDVTGAVVAAALDAAVYENWTDVSGVLMTDPRIVPEARSIAELTYHELRELSYMGATVLHEEAVFPVRAKGIPINIRNTNRPEDDGTRIVARRDSGSQIVTGIAGSAGFTVITIEKAMMNSEVGFVRRVLDVFGRHGISIEHLPSGIDTMSVVVADSQLGDKAELVVDELKGAVRPDDIGIDGDMALIATVGQGMSRHVGVAARLFSALSGAGINIRMIDQGSSERSIIVGVEKADLQQAIRAIYNAFVTA
jgi:aspartate kinase